MRRTQYLLHVVLLTIFCVGFMGADTSMQGRFQSVGHKLMCKCGCNQILLECNHVGCTYSDSMRDELMAALERGDSDDLVLQDFVQKYGATVLSAPTTTGFNSVAWVMPFIALASGLTLVTVIVRKWKFRVAPVGVQNLSEKEREELRRRAREETKE